MSYVTQCVCEKTICRFHCRNIIVWLQIRLISGQFKNKIDIDARSFPWLGHILQSGFSRST